jgi:cell division protein FtsL
MNTIHAPQSLRSPDRTAPGRSAAPLRIVELQPRTHKGRVFAIAMVMVFLALLGNAVLSSILVTNQKHLDTVSADVAAERSKQQRLQVELAGLRSPERIVNEAKKMGMTRPDSVTFLGTDDEADEPDRSGTAADEGYAEDATAPSGSGSKDKAGR